jgi:hypothetical protein
MKKIESANLNNDIALDIIGWRETVSAVASWLIYGHYCPVVPLDAFADNAKLNQQLASGQLVRCESNPATEFDKALLAEIDRFAAATVERWHTVKILNSGELGMGMMIEAIQMALDTAFIHRFPVNPQRIAAAVHISMMAMRTSGILLPPDTAAEEEMTNRLAAKHFEQLRQHTAFLGDPRSAQTIVKEDKDAMPAKQTNIEPVANGEALRSNRVPLLNRRGARRANVERRMKEMAEDSAYSTQEQAVERLVAELEASRATIMADIQSLRIGSLLPSTFKSKSN